MYLYFFDLDDTICNTAQAVKHLESEYNLKKEDYASDREYFLAVDKKLREYGLDNINILENSTVSLLQQLIKDNSQDIYYITARESKVRESSILWLKKHNLWLGEHKLLMDTQDIKGKTINGILEDSDKQFAFLFDDLIDNHKEAAPYKKIISCFPF
jgi:acid phosphatase class B